MRKNEKEMLLNYENSIKKSREFSMAKLNHGLSLQQMQLLAYSIYCTQQNGQTKFRKADFEKKFGLSRYLTKDAYHDSDKVSSLRFSTTNLEEKKFRFTPIFSDFQYIDGLFMIEWNAKFLPHILELKDKYIISDLTITSQFKSSFSWTLYDFIKAHYGYWHKPITKEALMLLFGVEQKKTYKNTAQFKRGVLDVAIKEVNQWTEFEVWYKEIKEGRAIVGFDLIWSNGKTVTSATKNQIQELKNILDVIFEDVFKYVNLKNDDNRQRAIDLIREVEEIRLFTEEPICITKEKADFSIQKASSNLRELERMVEAERNITSQAPSFYNWLEERE